MQSDYPVITTLEAKIDDLYRNRSIARKVIGSDSGLLTTSTAIEEYIALKQDLNIPVGIRYLALSCIAAECQLYQDDREISQLKDFIGREINKLTPAEIVNAVLVVRSEYEQIYDCNRYEFDRYDRLAKETSSTAIPERDKFQHEDVKLLTDLQIEKIRAEEKVKFFRLTTVVIGVFIVGGGTGLALALLMRQQSPAIIVNPPQASVPIANVPPSTQTPISTPSPTVASTTEPNAAATSEPQISQDEAESLIKKWLEAKKRLFAPPFDRELGASLTLGKAYTDKVRGPSSDGTPDSSSEWLEKYGYYYSYGLQRIDRVNKFEVSGNSAVIDVTMTEDVTLYNSKGERQRERSSLEQKTVRYVLVKENDTLKISDYNNLTASKRRT